MWMGQTLPNDACRRQGNSASRRTCAHQHALDMKCRVQCTAGHNSTLITSNAPMCTLRRGARRHCPTNHTPCSSVAAAGPFSAGMPMMCKRQLSSIYNQHHTEHMVPLRLMMQVAGVFKTMRCMVRLRCMVRAHVHMCHAVRSTLRLLSHLNASCMRTCMRTGWLGQLPTTSVLQVTGTKLSVMMLPIDSLSVHCPAVPLLIMGKAACTRQHKAQWHARLRLDTSAATPNSVFFVLSCWCC